MNAVSDSIWSYVIDANATDTAGSDDLAGLGFLQVIVSKATV